MSYPTLEALKAKREAAQQELSRIDARVRSEELRLQSMSTDQKVAEELHRILCHLNHTDGCGWEYGSWQNPRDEQLAALATAQTFMKALPYPESEILHIVKHFPTSI